MSRDFQSEYDRGQVESHGGSSGDFTADPSQVAEPEPEPAPAEQFDPGEGLDYDPALDNEFAQPGDWEQGEPEFVDDPNEAIREVIREEMATLDPFGSQLEEYAAWDAERAEQQAAADQMAEAETAQAGYENLLEHFNSATHGRASQMLEARPELFGQVAAYLTNDWETFRKAGIAGELPGDLIDQQLTANAPAFVKKAIEHVQQLNQIEEMKANWGPKGRR